VRVSRYAHTASDAVSAEREEDALLVTLALNDPAEYARLYDRYVDVIYRHCYRRFGTATAAEDATSQTFLKALAALPRFDPNAGSFRAWLFTIANNIMHDQARRATQWNLRSIDEAAEVADRSPSPEEEAVADESRLSVREAVSRLSEDQRQVVELRLAGLTGPEIAKTLGRSHGAIRTAQRRAVLRLRTLLGVAPGTIISLDQLERGDDRND
jgi:RNA polymerase sigma-70 factor (ECF subfamily)